MQVCRFKMKKHVSRDELEKIITFAIISAECTYGQARVRLNASYLAIDSKAVIDVSSEVGEHIAQIFTGLLIREIGEEEFTVERITKDSLKE